MGKVNNALRMLAILRSRKKVTRKELAEELEVTVREITRYKDDLEYAGVNIITTAGKYGGYELQGNDYLLNLDLSNNEILYSAKAKGKTDLINWILGMGSNCRVLEPASLREDIINEYKKCIEKYKLS